MDDVGIRFRKCTDDFICFYNNCCGETLRFFKHKYAQESVATCTLHLGDEEEVKNYWIEISKEEFICKLVLEA